MKGHKQFEQDWLLELDQVIDDNLDNFNFTTQNLAFQLCLSSASLYRKIVKLKGVPPKEYIRRKKLHKAKELLDANADYSMQELATKVGYSRKDHFIKIFQETFELTLV